MQSIEGNATLNLIFDSVTSHPKFFKRNFSYNWSNNFANLPPIAWPLLINRKYLFLAKMQVWLLDTEMCFSNDLHYVQRDNVTATENHWIFSLQEKYRFSRDMSQVSFICVENSKAILDNGNKFCFQFKTGISGWEIGPRMALGEGYWF